MTSRVMEKPAEARLAAMRILCDQYAGEHGRERLPVLLYPTRVTKDGTLRVAVCMTPWRVRAEG